MRPGDVDGKAIVADNDLKLQHPTDDVMMKDYKSAPYLHDVCLIFRLVEETGRLKAVRTQLCAMTIVLPVPLVYFWPTNADRKHIDRAENR